MVRCKALTKSGFQRSLSARVGMGILMLGVMVGFVLSISASVMAQGPWDLATDFSTTSNPNGVWRYGGKMSVTASSFSTATSKPDWGNGYMGWAYPLVMKDTSGAGWDDGYSYVEPGMVTEAPGVNTLLLPMAATRFTSPVTAKLNVYARFTGRYYGGASGTTTDVHVVRSGVSLFDAVINGFAGWGGVGAWGDFEQIFSSDVTVASNGTIDFVVGAYNGSNTGDMTGVEVTISVVDTNVGTVSGTVSSNLGGTVSGAKVEALGTGLWTRTASNGAYSLILPQGTYTLEFSADGYVTAQQAGVVITTGGATTVNATLVDKHGTVSGKVTANAPGNPPVEGAKVSILGGSVSDFTDENGDYSLWVVEDTHTLAVSAGGYAYQEVMGVVITAGGTTTQNISLDANQVWNTATDYSYEVNPYGVWKYGGKSLPTNFSLSAEASDYYGGGMKGWIWPTIMFNTNDYSWSDGYSDAAAQMTTAHPGPPGDPMATYRFTSPVSAKVRIDARFSGRYYGGAKGTTADVHIYKNGVSLFDGLVSGYAGLDARPPFGSSPEQNASIHTTISQSDTVDFSVGFDEGSSADLTGVEGTITVLDDTLGAVTGTVSSNRAGNPPVAGARVEALGAGVSTLSNENGGYSLFLPSGAYTLDFSAAGFTSKQEANVSVSTGGTTPLNVILEELTGTISGRVTANVPGNLPIQGAKVQISDGSVWDFTDANGDYSMTVYEGTYTVNVSVGGYADGVASGLVVSAGATTERNFSLDLSLPWNASDEFSTEVNPNGVWRYGGKGDITNFSLAASSSDFYGGGMKGWIWPPVFKNTNAGRWNDGYSDADALMTTTHPGPPGDNMGTYRFVSPVNARVSIDVTFSGRYYGGSKGTTADVHVYKNGASLFDGVVSGYAGGGEGFPAAFGDAPTQTYTGEIVVAQGDTIDFAVGPTEDGTTGDLTGVMATIDVIGYITPGTPTDISDIKALADNTDVWTGEVAVTAVFGGSFYVEELNRQAGIRVDLAGSGVSVGRKVVVGGKIKTDPTNAERYIEGVIAVDVGSGSVDPLALNNRALGGGPAGLQQGITGASGLNNIGLLVTTTGTVSLPDASRFFLDDGSGVSLKVLSEAYPLEGIYVRVTGISSCELDAGEVKRVIRAITVEEITP
ncbi:MAG: carboxypeptidase regulatory-like domain-containing protein [Armatimonadetes bacterium]|nr:carboxypeptidase regulatory-like domain-containing protein [Armatimonadota bacterium]